METPPANLFHRLLVITFIVLSGCLYLTSNTIVGQEILSPPQFSHKTHTKDNIISCEFCHYYGDRSTVAGIPSLIDCLGCHQLVKGSDDTQRNEIGKLNHFLMLKQTLSWNRNNNLPDFVYFTHQHHISTGFKCEECHGDLSHSEQESTAGIITNLTMGWCVDCHVKEKALPDHQLPSVLPVRRSESELPETTNNLKASIDCQTCHK